MPPEAEPPPPRLKRGDVIRLRRTADDEWCQAWVALASDTDPSSVMLLLNPAITATKGIIAGTLPLTIDYTAETATSLFGDVYEIEVAEFGPA